MPSSYEEAVNRVLAQLSNAKKMAINRQNRRLAMDVLRACSLYVKGTRFPCDPQIFEALAASIIDKRDTAIMEEFAKVEKVLKEGFHGAEKKSWRTLKLPR
jgi:hypothetical protein